MKLSCRILRCLWLVLGMAGTPAFAQVTLNEFLASNSRGLVDSDGDTSDWIELFNAGGSPVNLQGWSITDDANLPRKWVFPSVQIPANGYLLVFASGKNRTNPAAPLHANFSLSVDGEYLGLYRPEGGTAASEFTPSYPPQRPDISYGLRAGQLFFFDPPSPRVGNTGGVGDFVADTKFNRDRGVYDTPFDLEITCATVGATIRYTTNGAPPSATVGFVYTAPIRVARSVVIRAGAFKTGLQPSGVDTHTYLFPADVIRQQPSGQVPWSEWPTPGSQSQDYDYGMDPRIVDSALYRDQIIPALKALPAMSLVTGLSNLFSTSTGIFANPGQDGRDWERPASLELIHADGREGFQIDCGVRIRGGFSRSPGNPKHAFRFFFREQYGDSKLRYPLHAGGVEEFDALDLRTFQNYSWSFDPGGGQNGVFIRDVFSRDTQLAMGQQGERGNYYHLYINGVYWGIFNSCERPEANYGEAYFGGVAENYDVIKVEAGAYALNATDGNMEAWTRLYNLCRNITPATANTTYWRVQGRNLDGTVNASFENLLDVDNLIDYMLVIVFGGNLDAPISNFLGNTRPNNWYGLRDRSGQNGGFRFISHDAEHSLLDVNQNRVLITINGVQSPLPAGNDSVLYSSPQYLWQRLWASPEFRLRIADRVQRHFFNGGALTLDASRARFAARTNQLYLPVVAESARWGDSKQSTPLTRDTHWLTAANRVLNTYLPARGGIVLNQLRGPSLLPSIASPVLGRHGGVVSNGFGLTMTGPANGVLVYTLNGTDPRELGGAQSAGARPYTAPVVLATATQVKARMRRTDGVTNEWSALTEAVFHVAQDFSGLQLSEIHYHPLAPVAPSTDSKDEFEFIELKNAGNTVLDLSGVRIEGGIQYTFPLGTRLEAGRFLLLVENPVAFTSRYPQRIPDGVYAGQLSNSGERIAVVNAAGETVLDVSYGTEVPWPTTPDGVGFSLVPRDPVRNPAPAAAASWRASTQIGGSPGGDDPASGIVPVVIHEVLAHTDLPAVDAIELFNPSATPAAIGGWYLSDDAGEPRKFRIPAGTTVPAGGFLVLDESAFNAGLQETNAFRLSSTGDDVVLFSAAADGTFTGYSDRVSFGASFNGTSLVRWTNSVGEVSMVSAVAPTFGGFNAVLRVSPVVLQEIYFAALPGEVPFVEVWNRSDVEQVLFDPENPSNTWRIAGLDFAFPTGVRLPPGGFAVVTESDPTLFRQRNGLPESVPVFGPTPGQLQRNGERLELLMPDRPNRVTNHGVVSIEVPYVGVDAVRYNDREPWPTAATLGGVSLERRFPTLFGDDPASWRAALSGPSPGGAANGNRAPRVEAGPDRELSSRSFPLPVTLAGAAIDDGLPEGNPVTFRWTQVAGPRGVVFRNGALSNGVVELPGAGIYVLRMFASDGEREVSDDLQLTVVRPGSDATFIPFGSAWRYFDQNQNQGTAWRARTFNDAAWNSGRARLGYGDDGIATVINGGPSNNRIRTAYFRHRFTVADSASVTRLTASVVRDDGAVVYLNGQEVFRVSMPEGEIGFTTFASEVMGGADETTPVVRDIPASLLVNGDNLIAIEVHQANAGSSDLGLDFALSGTVQESNQAPVVDAGTNGQLTLSATAALRGTFTDDGLPASPGVPAFAWTRVSGPGTVTFSGGDTLTPEAAFSAAGTYVLQLSVADGQFTRSDTVTWTVQAPPVPPVLVGLLESGEAGFRFNASAGVAYRVRARESLDSGVWQEMRAIPAGIAREVRFVEAPTATTRFYQVVVE